MPQGKKATIKDVAREAKVSISVVSYVLNSSTEKSISPATRDRVMEAAKRLQYVPNRAASGMRRKHSMVIGVVSYWELDVLVFTDMMKGITRKSSAANYRILFCHRESKQDDVSYLQYCQDGSIDGIVFIAPYESLGLIDEAFHIRQMKEAKVPFVVLNGSTHEDGVSYINVDYCGSTYLATSYLIGKGHKDIAYVAPLELHYTELERRLQGYQDAMRGNRLPVRCHDVKELPDCLHGLKAVVTNKSDTAHSVLQAAHKLGIDVPRELAVIAANTEAYSSYLFPPLSTVRIPAERMGELAVETLLEQLTGAAEPKLIMPPCALEIRQTC